MYFLPNQQHIYNAFTQYTAQNILYVLTVLQTEASLSSACLHYLQYVVELCLELKVRFGFHNDPFEGLLQHLNPSLSLLTGVCDAHVLPLTAESLLLGFIHL